MLEKEGPKIFDSPLERFFDEKNRANIKAFDVPHNFFYDFQELFSDYNNSKFSEEYEEMDRDNVYIIDSIRSRECSFIKRFLFSPSKDASQIQERGKIIEQLSSLENLDELIQIKNLSYDISIGIHNLVCLRGGYDDKEKSLLERLAHGDKEMKIYDDDDYRCWGPPIGKIEILPLIQEEVGRIEKGFIILQQLTDSLTSQTDPILKKFFADMPSSIEKIKSELNILIPLKDSEIKDRHWWGDYHCGEKIEEYLFQIATLLEYARINRNEKWGEVTFDPNKPDSYIQGWNIKTKKNEQVRNDSPADFPVIVLKGPNTSGKSFFIDKDFLIRTIAQSLGRGPVDSANLHICNNFIYINRSTTDSSNNLSAFMKEVTNMKTIIPLINKNTRIWMDEGYSTTSSEDQIKLLLLTAQYVINKNAKIIIATHNDKKIDGASNYCLATDIDPTSGDLIRHFRLEPGSGDSQSLTVARMRNYPETTLHWSESYYNQKNELPIPMTDSKYQEIKTFTESERNQMKKEVSSLNHLFPESPNNSIFHLYSVDRDFSASHIFSGSKHSRKISSIESLILSVEDQKTMLGKMILWAPELSPAQKLERQKTISELIKDNIQERLHESILKTIELDQIISNLQTANKNGFLQEFNPFSKPKDISFSIEILNAEIAFLNIQKKILKDNFQYEKMLNDLTIIASTYEQASEKGKKELEKNTINLFTELTNANNDFPKIFFKDINIDEIKDELIILKETSTIASVLDSLSQNLQESQSFINQIKSLDSVYLHQAANLLKQEIDNQLDLLNGKEIIDITTQNNQLSINPISQYDHINRKTFSFSDLYGVKIKSNFYKTLEQIDALCLYADIAQQEKKSPVIFNSTGEIKLDDVSNILTKIKDEKKNNLHFDPKKERVQILTGPNGSGKTSYEKGTIGAILEGNSIGYVSAKAATMPMFDGVAYLDRVTERQDKSLSAYAQEIEYFKELLPLIKSKKTLFVSIDEGFSTTSARYQEALSFGVLCEFLQSPHFIQFATHNHEFVNFFQDSKISLVKPYNFKFSIVDNKIKWHYKLREGHELSYGVLVAKTMGLSFD